MVSWREIVLSEIQKGRVNPETLIHHTTAEGYSAWLKKEVEAGNWVLSYERFQQIESGPGIQPVCHHHRTPFDRRFWRFEKELKKVARDSLMSAFDCCITGYKDWHGILFVLRASEEPVVHEEDRSGSGTHYPH